MPPIVGEHRCAVKNCVGHELGHCLIDGDRIAYVDRFWRVAGLFEIRQAVEADHLPALAQQTVLEKTPEKSGRAGDNCPHLRDEMARLPCRLLRPCPGCSKRSSRISSA